MKNLLPALGLLLALIIVSSCAKDEQQAIDTLRGKWKVSKILTIYEHSSSEEERVEEEGDLGSFTFDEETVDWTFTRNDTLYDDSGVWLFERERVSEGFITVPENTLTIENLSVFDVMFEDGTKNSEKNASELTLTQVEEESDNLFLQIILTK